jgi:hypothetical protein
MVQVVSVLLPGVETSQLPHPNRVLARIDHGTTRPNESRATLDVEKGAIPGVSQPARRHAVPIADSRGAQHVEGRLRSDNGGWVKRLATQVQVADFAFNAQHEVRAGGLPIASESARRWVF